MGEMTLVASFRNINKWVSKEKKGKGQNLLVPYLPCLDLLEPIFEDETEEMDLEERRKR